MRVDLIQDLARDNGWQVEEKQRRVQGMTVLTVVFRRGFRTISALWAANPRTGKWNFQHAQSEDDGYYAGVHDLREHLSLPADTRVA